MKKLALSSFLLFATLHLATAQPKLAIIGVEPSHALAKRLGYTPENATPPVAPPPAPAPAPVASAPVKTDFAGVWIGVIKVNGARRIRPNYQIIISRRPNSSYHADISNLINHRACQSDALVCDNNHFRLTFQGEQGPATIEGDYVPALNAVEAQWNIGPRHLPYTLSRRGGPIAQPPPAQMAAASPSEPPTIPPIDVILRELDTQFVDHFQSARTFTVVEDADIRQAVPLHGEEYNMKDSATQAAFQKEGIAYVLITTLEDASDQTLDEARGSVAYNNTSYNGQYAVQRNGPNVVRTANGAIVNNTGRFDPHIKKDQIVRLTLRCRLFVANNGALLDSVTHSFVTNRAYVALAAGNNMESTSDLFESTAASVADWTTLRVGDAIFPIKVLDKDNQVVTLNRGSQSGIHIGQTFDVFVTGKEIKDPTTGEVLGRDDIKAGRVAVSSVRDKFSKASVLADTGITPGAILRPPEN